MQTQNAQMPALPDDPNAAKAVIRKMLMDEAIVLLKALGDSAVSVDLARGQGLPLQGAPEAFTVVRPVPANEYPRYRAPASAPTQRPRS